MMKNVFQKIEWKNLFKYATMMLPFIHRRIIIEETAMEKETLKKLIQTASGEIEADKGEPPCFGLGMEEAVNAYQKEVLNYKSPDGEVTAGKKAWKSLLGMI